MASAFLAEGGREAVDEGAVGQVLLARVAARGDGGCTLFSHVGHELFGKPGLPDAGLSFDDDDATPLTDGRVRFEQSGPFRFPSYQGVLWCPRLGDRGLTWDRFRRSGNHRPVF